MMYLPSIFGDDLMDDFFGDFDRGFLRPTRPVLHTERTVLNCFWFRIAPFHLIRYFRYFVKYCCYFRYLNNRQQYQDRKSVV